MEALRDSLKGLLKVFPKGLPRDSPKGGLLGDFLRGMMMMTSFTRPHFPDENYSNTVR